jgi:ribosomal protein L7/L12
MSLEQQISDLQKDNSLLRARVAKLERTVAFLLDHTHATYVDQPDEGPFPDVVALVRSGNRLEAIKLYRAKTGASLAQAQEYVNGL